MFEPTPSFTNGTLTLAINFLKQSILEYSSVYVSSSC